MLLRCDLETPVGPLVAVSLGGKLLMLEFVERDRANEQLERLSRRMRFNALPTYIGAGGDPILHQTETELAEYFAGTRKTFDIPLDPQGTDFERRAWDALLTIPYGKTRSYGQQAAVMGDPDAVRAVGRANGRNMIAIVIPCHRVIGAGGGLTGYGGGIDRKRWLLDHESKFAPEPSLFTTAAV